MFQVWSFLKHPFVLVAGTLPSMAMAPDFVTHFLNVDLDIISKNDLQPLVGRLGRKVHVLFVGQERGRFSAHLEIARTATTADLTIRAFCRLIGGLPESERKIWDAAVVRSFSIGIQAEVGSPVRDFQIRQGTVAAVSNVGAAIVLTVYTPTRTNRPN